MKSNSKSLQNKVYDAISDVCIWGGGDGAPKALFSFERFLTTACLLCMESKLNLVSKGFEKQIGKKLKHCTIGRGEQKKKLLTTMK